MSKLCERWNEITGFNEMQKTPELPRKKLKVGEDLNVTQDIKTLAKLNVQAWTPRIDAAKFFLVQ